MQENQEINSLNQQGVDSTPTVAAIPTNEQQPKSNKFLVVLLSVLLFVSSSIAIFFAFQTQKMVKELSMVKTMPTDTPKNAEAPVATMDPTESWKLYSGKLFNFKYPAMMILERQDVEDPNDSKNIGDMVQLKSASLSIQVSSNFNGGWGGNPCLVTKDKIVAGQDSNILYFYKSIDGNETCSEDQYEGLAALIGTHSAGHPYPIIVELQTQGEAKTVDLDLFNQLLSTFKLVN